MFNIEFLISTVLVPIITAIITVFLTVYFNEKLKKEKLIIIYNKLEEEYEKSNIIYGDYDKNNEFEFEFREYLESQNYIIPNYIKNLLYKSYINFRNKTYTQNKITLDNEKNEISKMINYFKNNFDFIYHIKRYEVYINNSNWNFKLVNIGNNQIYDLKVNVRKSLTNLNNFNKEVLNPNEYFEMNINYFDSSIRINSFDFGLNVPFEFGYSKYIIPYFYIVNKFLYNKKDEIVCDISYLNCKGKKYEYHICFKQNNKLT